MSELDTLKAELLPLVRSVVKRGTFTLASGKTSNVYFDAREVTLNARGAYQTARVILAMLREEKVDAIGGLTLGADPIAGAVAAVSAQAGRPIHGFIVRKEAKAHGMGKVVEGPALPAGARVVVVDDVVTSGGSELLSPPPATLMMISTAAITAAPPPASASSSVRDGPTCCGVFVGAFTRGVRLPIAG